MKMFADKIM